MILLECQRNTNAGVFAQWYSGWTRWYRAMAPDSCHYRILRWHNQLVFYYRFMYQTTTDIFCLIIVHCVQTCLKENGICWHLHVLNTGYCPEASATNPSPAAQALRKVSLPTMLETTSFRCPAVAGAENGRLVPLSPCRMGAWKIRPRHSIWSDGRAV